MIDNSLILVNLNSGTVLYDPSQAGANGFQETSYFILIKL